MCLIMKISLSNKQSMLLSFAMKQSLDILQMPIEELMAFLVEVSERNPLLSLEHQPSPHSLEELSENLPESLSCFSYIMQQAYAHFTQKADLSIAEWIAGNIDQNGFYCVSKEPIPPFCSLEQLLHCLEIIRNFDPPGIAAENTQESLRKQLELQGKQKSLSYLLLANGWENILLGRYSALQKDFGVDKHTILKAIREDIRPLDPFPGRQFFKTNPSIYAVDAILEIEEGQWESTISSPSIEIETIPHTPLPSEEKKQLQAFRSEAQLIVRALAKRKKTLQQVLSYLSIRQKSFLLGEGPPQPLTLEEAAHDLQMHPSTLSRTIAHKTLLTHKGILALKQCFAKALTPEHSVETAKQLLQKLIAEEDKKKPLSDEDLFQKLRQEGIPCARRTITKYRNTLEIPTQKKRKWSSHTQ